MTSTIFPVSFGYTEELWRFWQRCGFVLVRMGNHREVAAVAIRRWRCYRW